MISAVGLCSSQARLDLGLGLAANRAASARPASPQLPKASATRSASTHLSQRPPEWSRSSSPHPAQVPPTSTPRHSLQIPGVKKTRRVSPQRLHSSRRRMARSRQVGHRGPSGRKLIRSRLPQVTHIASRIPSMSGSCAGTSSAAADAAVARAMHSKHHPERPRVRNLGMIRSCPQLAQRSKGRRAQDLQSGPLPVRVDTGRCRRHPQHCSTGVR